MTGYLSESYVQEGEAGMRRKPYIVKQQQSLILAKRGGVWHLVDATVTCFCLPFAKIMKGPGFVSFYSGLRTALCEANILGNCFCLLGESHGLAVSPRASFSMSGLGVALLPFLIASVILILELADLTSFCVPPCPFVTNTIQF